MLIAHHTHNRRAVEISSRDLSRHLYLLGKTGTAKTSLAVNLALQQAATGDGLCFIDPHGDASQAILAPAASGRARDLHQPIRTRHTPWLHRSTATTRPSAQR